MFYTMKKFAVLLITTVFILGMLVSCNKSVCPAYVKENKTQVEKNS